MTHSLVSPPSAPSPVSPVPPPLSAPWLEAQGWKRLSSALPPGELETLGFLAASEAAARQGAWLAPVLWHTGERVVVRSHRLLLDDGALHEPRKGPRRPLLAALGALRSDPAAWPSVARRLVLVEGDGPAAALAAVLPGEAVMACPRAACLDDEDRERLRLDLRRLVLRDRVVVLVAAGEGPSSPLLAALLTRLTDAGAVVHRAGALPAPGLEAPAPEHEAALAAWLARAAPLVPVDVAATGPARLLREVLAPAFWAGPEHLAVPEPYLLLDGPTGPLAVQRRKRVIPFCSSAFWPIGEVEDPAGKLLLLAMVVQSHGRWRVVRALMPRTCLYDNRQLGDFFGKHGINLFAAEREHAAPYLTSFLHHNTLPTVTAQTQSGWTRDRTGFQYGEEPLGEVVFRAFDEDEATRQFFAALHPAGDPALWKQTAESLVAAAPAAALVLAASIASPMLRLFGWPTIGVLFGALGGAGKSSLLRLAASVFGASGDPARDQAGGLVGKADGSIKGLLLQFRRMADLPHLGDELKPSTTDARQREDLADVLHQIFEGQEYVRATRSSTGTRVGLPFPGCVVVAGEVAPSDFLRKGGVVRRYLAPPAPYVPPDKPLGESGQTLAENYGHLGRALCEALLETTTAQRREMASRHALYLESLAITPQHPEHIRSWSRQIATALAAIDVGAQLCPALCPHPTLTKGAIHAVWQQILASDDGQSSDLGTVVEEKIRGWVARHRYHLQASRPLRETLRLRGSLDDHERLLLVPREPALGQVAQAEREGEPDEVLLKVDIFQTALRKFLQEEGYSEGTLTRLLADRGLIETTEGQTRQGAVGRNVRVNGTVTRVYRLVLAAPAPSSERAA